MSNKENGKLQITSFKKTNPHNTRHILIVESPESRLAVTLNVSTYTIGRHPSNALVISGKQVSRHHATILWLRNSDTGSCCYWILDGDTKGKRSLNGISVNEKKYHLHQLKHGDLIKIGNDIKMKYNCFIDQIESFDCPQSTETEKPTNLVSGSYHEATIIHPFQ